MEDEDNAVSCTCGGNRVTRHGAVQGRGLLSSTILPAKACKYDDRPPDHNPPERDRRRPADVLDAEACDLWFSSGLRTGPMAASLTRLPARSGALPSPVSWKIAQRRPREAGASLGRQLVPCLSVEGAFHVHSAVVVPVGFVCPMCRVVGCVVRPVSTPS